MLKRLMITAVVVIFVTGCGSNSLSFDTLTFASDVTKTGAYTKLTDTEFKENQKVFVVAEVSGFASEQIDDTTWTSWPVVTLKLRNAEGKLLNTTQSYTDMVETGAAQTEFKLPSEVTITAKPGIYRLEVIVEDGITGERVTGELRFDVE